MNLQAKISAFYKKRKDVVRLVAYNFQNAESRKKEMGK